MNHPGVLIVLAGCAAVLATANLIRAFKGVRRKSSNHLKWPHLPAHGYCPSCRHEMVRVQSALKGARHEGTEGEYWVAFNAFFCPNLRCRRAHLLSVDWLEI